MKEFIESNEFIELNDELGIDFIKPYEFARDAFNNGRLHIAKDCIYSLNDHITQLNNNVLVVGGTGTGKTRHIVSHNILEAVGSYVISDPKGTLRKKYGKHLKKHGYKIRDIDFTHPKLSEKYNPLLAIRTTQDIVKLAHIISYEARQANVSISDPFWEDSCVTFINGIVGYMQETGYKPFNFNGILRLVREGERENEDDNRSSLLAKRFETLRRKNPKSWACGQFDDVNAAPTKTYNCIRITLTSKLAAFDTPEIQQMMEGGFDFTDIGTEKTALFVTVSDTDRCMDALVNIFFTQTMQLLCSYADNFCDDFRLPIPVRFILDDFATNCRIDEFPRMISTIRSRGISAMLMVQSEAQLEKGYAQDSKTIISNCDTYVYLGGNDLRTAAAIGERCNKPPHRILCMPLKSCWVFRRGCLPVYTTLLEPPNERFLENEL